MFFSINWSAINWDVARTVSESFLPLTAIIISVVAIIKTSKDNNTILKETSKYNNRILEETSRAYISIYTEALIANRSYFYIVFRNFGKNNAFIQDIKIDEKTREMIKIGDKDFISYINKSNIAPGQSITHLVSTKNEKYDYDHDSKFEITYLSGGKEYTDKFEFCLGANTRTPSISISDGKIDKQFLELYQDQIRRKL